MAYTKRDIVEQAFEEIGLASYVFDLQPQQLSVSYHDAAACKPGTGKTIEND